MSELSPKTRALLDAARSAGGSTPDDRARVFASIAAKAGLAAAAGSAAAAPSSASAAGAPVAVAGSKLALVVAVASSIAAASAGTTILWLRSHRSVDTGFRVAAPVAASRARTLAIPPPEHEPPSTAATPPTDGPRGGTTEIAVQSHVDPSRAPIQALSTPHARATARPIVDHATANADAGRARESSESSEDASALGEELALLRGARAALRSHDEATAVALLEQHARRYPNGMLREERDATLVLAFCGLGRRDDAAHAVHRFLNSFPHSPYADRVRASCAGETP